MPSSLLSVIAMALLALAPAAHAASRKFQAGFQEFRIDDGGAKPLTVGVWYPTLAPASEHRLDQFTQKVAMNGPVAGRALPLVVMSHGHGGWFGGHSDTALVLARAGFVAAAVTHNGDSHGDVAAIPRLQDRPEQIKRLIDYMTAEWPDHQRIDPDRIGVFGFSAGGFTALVVAGGVPDLSRIPAHCRARPTVEVCQIVRSLPPGTADQIMATPASLWVHDPRIKAAVVAAPGLGFTFGKDGLSGVRVPVQLWRAENDHIEPNPDYAETVRNDLPIPPDYHVVANADHYDFLAPCPAQLAAEAPEICKSAPGFSRTAFHTEFNNKVTAFFEATLK